MTAVARRTVTTVASGMQRYLALDDFERAARKRLPRMIYGFIAGAAETNSARDNNRLSYEKWTLVPRVLRDVSDRNMTTRLFGGEFAAPFGVAPMGAAALCGYCGDLSLARAATAANVPMVISAASLIRLEEIRAAAPKAWYQAYLPGDPERILPTIRRVAEAGVETLVVTADIPVPANRENNVRNGFQLPLVIRPSVVIDCALHPRWLFGVMGRTLARRGMPHFENMEAMRGPPVLSRNLTRNIGKRDRLSWEHIELIRRNWRGHLVIKGILSREDVRLAQGYGVDGVIVSNHGGRQLDHSAAPLDVLPEIVESAKGLPVMIDGGVRRGTDVIKALALGAKFVFVGRPFLFAAAVAGDAGVNRAIALLAEEVDRDMALLGVTSLSELAASHVRDNQRPAPGGRRTS